MRSGTARLIFPWTSYAATVLQLLSLKYQSPRELGGRNHEYQKARFAIATS